MGELESEYGGRVDFTVVPPAETALATEELEAFGFAALRHGLVAFSSSGEAVVKIPGHEFGREEIVAAIETALATD